MAGQNPTRSSFIANLRKVTNYNVEGLASNTVNFSNEQTIPTQTCSYYVQLVGQAVHRAEQRQASLRHAPPELIVDRVPADRKDRRGGGTHDASRLLARVDAC